MTSATGETVENGVELAERTVSRVQAAVRDNNTACVAQVVELIREITARPDAISVHHLAELIERDVAVVAEVIRIANTIGFNPEGVEIVSVDQAIQAIGFMKIRNLAVSLLLLKNAGQLANPRESREVSALAVTCGYLAEVGGERFGQADPGYAFVCAALRHYGNLLLTTFLTEECRQASALAKTMSEDEAFCEVFGLTALDLGRRVLEFMNLPGSILGTFRPMPEKEERRALGDSKVHLLAVTDFAMEVTAWLTARHPVGSMESLTKRLAERYESVLELQGPVLKEIVIEVDHRLSVVRGSLGSLPMLDRIRAAVSGGRGAAPGAPGGSAKPRRHDATRLLLDGISEVSDLLGAPVVKGPQIFLAGARSVEAALSLVDCWVFRRHTTEPVYRPFLGSGPLFPHLPARASVDPRVRTVFTLCVERGEIVVLTHPDNPKIAPYVPAWLSAVTGEAPLVLVPVGNAGSVLALLCGVGEAGHFKELSPAVRRQLQVLARLLAFAREA